MPANGVSGGRHRALLARRSSTPPRPADKSLGDSLAGSKTALKDEMRPEAWGREIDRTAAYSADLETSGLSSTLAPAGVRYNGEAPGQCDQGRGAGPPFPPIVLAGRARVGPATRVRSDPALLRSCEQAPPLHLPPEQPSDGAERSLIPSRGYRRFLSLKRCDEPRTGRLLQPRDTTRLDRRIPCRGSA